MLNDYSNYTTFWNKDDFLELNDEMVEENINYYINEITEYSYEIFGENKNEKKSRISYCLNYFMFYVFETI